MLDWLWLKAESKLDEFDKFNSGLGLAKPKLNLLSLLNSSHSLAVRGFWPIQPNDRANFKGPSKVYSGLSLASNQRQARRNLLNSLNSLKLAGSALALARQGQPNLVSLVSIVDLRK